MSFIDWWLLGQPHNTDNTTPEEAMTKPFTIDPPDPTQPADAWCNTAGCFAGWRAFRDQCRVLRHTDYGSVVIQTTSGEARVSEYAQGRFELSRMERLDLFAPGNSLADLKDRVDDLCGQPDRSEKSKALLQETMQDVLDADAVGRWSQWSWVSKARP